MAQPAPSTLAGAENVLDARATAPVEGPGWPRSDLGKLLAAEPADVGLAAEAVLVLLVARAAVRVVSLRSAVDFLGRLVAAAGPEACPPCRLAWAVDAASARFGGACLARSLALQATLARRGVAGEICIAVRGRGGPLPGHAWVEVDGRPLGADGRAAAPGHASGFEVLSRLSSGER